MYKVLTSLWSKGPSSQNKTRLSSVNSSDSSIDEESWVFVSETASNVPSITTTTRSEEDASNGMNNSWIASPPLPRSETRSASPSSTHHFNPIENLLIEHASMSVYEQIASRTRARRQRKDQIEDDDDEDDDEEDDRSSVVLQSQCPSQSIHHRILNSSVSTLESSTSSLFAHQRHLQRIHQRRRRSSKFLFNPTTLDESKVTNNKILERQRVFNYPRSPKMHLHQPSRLNH